MVGHSRPVDGGGAVSAFHPFATKSARATNAALGQEETSRSGADMCARSVSHRELFRISRGCDVNPV
jgi:hypothetical protein